MSASQDGQDTMSKLAQPAPNSGANAFSGLRIIDSSDLLGGHSSLIIRHLGEVYRLQITRQGKLILTK
jgi:hemin uptake protein HemP